jgi:hypothetical protein
MYRNFWILCAVAALGLTGCNTGWGHPAAATSARAPAVNSASGQPAGELPSYPILLTDLPRYEAGLSVPPARSRMIGSIDGDLDSPSRNYVAASPALRRVPAPSPAPVIAKPPPKSDEPIDLRYVP